MKRDIVPLVVALCQDVNNEVRAAGCGPLAALAQSAGSDVLKSHIINALVDVANDDCPAVRQAAFPAVIIVCPQMPAGMSSYLRFRMFSRKFENLSLPVKTASLRV